ncbi:MAG: T9SS type A sorting domain-containing protein, partial [Bacteroidota bacterium]
ATGGQAPYSGTGAQTTAAGTWSYTVTDDNGCSSTSASVTLVEPSKVQGATTSNDATCGLNNGTATVTATGGVGSYSYLWSNGQTTATATSLSTGNYTVTISDANGCTSSASATVASSSATVGVTGTLQGATGACRNTTATFTIAPVGNASNYSWNLPAGATGTSTTNSITVSFGSGYNGGFVCVTPSNSCGAGNQACINVPVLTIKPNAPAGINGPANPCGPGTYTYSVVPVPNATSYTWSLSGTTATIISGQGTNTIQIATTTAFNSTQVSVSASNCNGNSSAINRTFYGILVISTPLRGNMYPCSGSTETYSCDNIAGATSIGWTVTGNASVTSSTATGCTVSFASNWAGGSLNLGVTNACGTAVRSYTLYASPLQPGGITGPASALCPTSGTNSATYSIASVAGATSYNWTVPTGMQINSNSGITNTLTVNINNNYTGGNVCVTANNACVASTPRCLVTTAKPATPTTISGPATVCKSQSAVSYSVTPVTGAGFYSWIASNGVGTTQQGTGTTALVDFTSAGASTSILSVRSNNNCGASSPANFNVIINLACRQAMDTQESLSLLAYPNPSNGNFFVGFDAVHAGFYVLELKNVLGQVVSTTKIVAEEGEQRLDWKSGDLKSGVYLLALTHPGGETETIRLIVE